MSRADGGPAGRTARRLALRTALPAALGAALLILLGGSCARNRMVSRPDVTPRLTAGETRGAALEAAQIDPEAGAALNEDEQLAHVILRTSFGPRPGERARIGAEGIAAYLEEQLHPEMIDDSAFEQRLAQMPGAAETTAQRVQELDGYRKDQKEKHEKKAREDAARELAMGSLDAGISNAGADESMAGASAKNSAAEAADGGAAIALDRADGGPEADRMHANDSPAAAKEAPPAKPVASAAVAKTRRRGKKDFGKIGRGPGFDFTLELSEAKLLRAVYSKKQLQEVMTDFWFNHFNVFAGKDRESALLPAYENEVIRAHALGSFRELLLATAHSPAMLIYLDNWRSTASEMEKHKPGEIARAKRGRGLNENYGRELLELHTLGVDGGYTQADVTNVARCFTGWSVADPEKDPQFVFHPKAHDRGEKRVLGETIAAGGGEDDGDRVLEMLLRNPATARFIASKLVRRFVSDDPPPALVAKVAQVYLDTLPSGGDIRSMLRAIFSSPEFWSRRAVKAKMRSPLELVAASARALDADIGDPLQLARQVARIGEPLFAYAPPTGYGDTAATWASSGALLARIDFGLALAAGQLDGVDIDLAPLAAGAQRSDEVLARASAQLGAPDLSETTRRYVLEQLRDLPLQKRPELVAERTVGLLLGAPELQRR